MSQIFNLGLSFYSCQKTGNFLTFFKTFFSRFRKMKIGPNKNSETLFPPFALHVHVLKISSRLVKYVGRNTLWICLFSLSPCYFYMLIDRH